MANWTQIAAGQLISDGTDNYQIKLYYDTTDSYTVKSIVTLGDYRLRSGTESRDKFAIFYVSFMDFTVMDEDNWLYKLIKGKSQWDFRGVIEKNGTPIFNGYILNQRQKYDVSADVPQLPLRMIDGLERLKEFTDFSSLTGISRLSEVFYLIFGSLEFSQDITVYMSIYQDADSPPYSAGFKIEDYLNLKPDLNYYTLLQELSKQLNLSYIQEDNVWIVRQDISMRPGSTPNGVLKTVITSGVAGAASRVNVELEFDLDDLLAKPSVFNMKGVDACEISCPVIGADHAASLDHHSAEIGWQNGDFRNGSNGWTVDSGTASFLRDCLQVQPGGQVSQESDEIASGETVRIELSVSCIRLSTQLSESLITEDVNPLFVVVFNGNDGNTYYLHNGSLTWTTSYSSLNTVFGMTMPGVKNAAGSAYIEEYNKKTYEFSQDIVVPATAGTLEIRLLGGGTVSGNNYPLEVSAQHNYCRAGLKYVEDLPDVPSEFLVTADSGSLRNVKSLSVLFHDKDPFSAAHWYGWDDDPFVLDWYEAKTWSPDGKTIMEYVATEIVKFNSTALQGIDVRFKGNVSPKFSNLLKSNLLGTGNNYYLPVFIESFLVSGSGYRGTSRVIAIKHERSGTPTVTKEYRY